MKNGAVLLTTANAHPHRRRAAMMTPTRTHRTTRGPAAAAASAASSSVESQQAAFTAWRDGKGIKSPNVEVAYFGEADDTVMRYRGVRAKSKLSEGDVLVELPRDSCLVLMDDAELPFPDFCTGELWAKLTEKNKWAMKVALNLLHEVNKGPDGTFHTYIEQLPKDFDLLSMWSDEAGGGRRHTRGEYGSLGAWAYGSGEVWGVGKRGSGEMNPCVSECPKQTPHALKKQISGARALVCDDATGIGKRKTENGNEEGDL